MSVLVKCDLCGKTVSACVTMGGVIRPAGWQEEPMPGPDRESMLHLDFCSRRCRVIWLAEQEGLAVV